MTERKPLPRQEFRVRLDQARKEIAEMATTTARDLQRLQQLMAITDDLWEATQPDEAPEYELRMVAAS